MTLEITPDYSPDRKELVALWTERAAVLDGWIEELQADFGRLPGWVICRLRPAVADLFEASGALELPERLSAREGRVNATWRGLLARREAALRAGKDGPMSKPIPPEVPDLPGLRAEDDQEWEAFFELLRHQADQEAISPQMAGALWAGAFGKFKAQKGLISGSGPLQIPAGSMPVVGADGRVHGYSTPGDPVLAALASIAFAIEGLADSVDCK